MKIIGHGVLLLTSFFIILLTTESWAAKPIPVCGDSKCRGDETVQPCPEDCALSR